MFWRNPEPFAPQVGRPGTGPTRPVDQVQAAKPLIFFIYFCKQVSFFEARLMDREIMSQYFNQSRLDAAA